MEENVKWEYKVSRSSNEEDLNKLGENGWEAVSMSSPGGILLKRPKQKIQPQRQQNNDYYYGR